MHEPGEAVVEAEAEVAFAAVPEAEAVEAADQADL